MKKIVILVAAAAGIAWAMERKKTAQKSAQPADSWAQASDPV
jgi:hypothetical protein